MTDNINEARKDANTVIPAGKGVNVEKSVVVNRPVEQLYRYWRNFENLPHIMNHLESVTVQSDTRSHWVAKAPLGLKVEWDAEIIDDSPNERISWRSIEGATVPNTGSVLFSSSGSGTEITVTLKYDPPGGELGAAIAKLFGEEPSVQIEEDLNRFRQTMEANAV